MKEIFSIVVKNIVLAALVGVALLGTITLCVAMPNILEWLTGYIGGFLTYSLFFLAIGGFIYWGVTRK